MSTDGDPVFGKPTAKVMLVGTFHFQDRGLDAYKPQFDVDMLSRQRQQEVADVVERLARFQPTKIAVERRPDRQTVLDQAYQAYLHGEYQLSGDEVDQLGFQLARRLNHQQVYGVDAWGRYYAPPIDLEAYGAKYTTKELQQFLTEQLDFDPHRDLTAYAQQHGQADLVTQWVSHIQRWGEQDDQAKTQRTLRETLLLGNTEGAILQSHGTYLVDLFKVGVGNEYPGVDLITAWYSRNLRIFANLQRITALPAERILLLIGGGHLPILRHCVLAAPDYELVEVHEFLA